MFPTHPLYKKIRPMDTSREITVYNDDVELFRGRMIDNEDAFYTEEHIECEGDLAYLNDSLVRPYHTQGSEESSGDIAPNTVDGYFAYLINQHNDQVEPSKRFIVGINEGALLDPNNVIVRADAKYPTTGTTLKAKLITPLGGYLTVRNVNGDRYIDYVANLDRTTTQKIKFGENLLDFSRDTQSYTLTTALVPLGGKIDKDHPGYTTIASVPDGLYLDLQKVGDRIYSNEAVEKYGYIEAMHTWDDVTTADALIVKAAAYLKQLLQPAQVIEISALDLSLMNPEIVPIQLGDYVQAL
jgi:hypothetical protein